MECIDESKEIHFGIVESLETPLDRLLVHHALLEFLHHKSAMRWRRRRRMTGRRRRRDGGVGVARRRHPHLMQRGATVVVHRQLGRARTECDTAARRARRTRRQKRRPSTLARACRLDVFVESRQQTCSRTAANFRHVRRYRSIHPSITPLNGGAVYTVEYCTAHSEYGSVAVRAQTDTISR